MKKLYEDLEVYVIDLSSANDNELLEISREMGLNISLDRMRYLKQCFRNRPLTDVELEMIAQTWSEHCFHNVFKGDVITDDGRTINSILKTYIIRATRELNKEWCISVFEDNAGIINFDKGYAIAAKVETHNHPSAVEPFGGAATGVGGVIRDILGVWGEPIALTDVLCFGPLETRYEDLPPGVKHPRYIYRGVVAGIGNYGNNMGIPTVSGAIFFDKGYTGNVIVYCGCIGILPKEGYVRKTSEGDFAVLAGGRTGRDGIHGVTFASVELTEETEKLRSAVQIPNPIVEERLRRAIIRIRDERLASGITDLGGGGLSCAAGEMAYRSGLGIDIDLDKVPLKAPDMAPWEIWISESQERMLLSVPEKSLERVIEIFREEDVEASVIGRFVGTGRIRVFSKGLIVCDLDLEFLFNPPKVIRRAKIPQLPRSEINLDEPSDLSEEILKLLSEPNIRSKEDVIRSYDHEVRGCTVVKPIYGDEAGPSDAAVIKPLEDSWMGVVISCGINPFYPDPYWMAANSIEEAIRNNVSVGGRRIALLDNFVWGNPENEDNMGQLLRAVEACYDFSKILEAPFISGKDSLYNESPLGPVKPTLLITGIGIIPDIRRVVTPNLKEEGNLIYIIGLTREELRGSAYLRLKGIDGGEVPKVNGEFSKKIIDTLVKAIDEHLILSCHDLSEGGLGVAAAEMVVASKNLGIEIDIRNVPSESGRSDYVLFSESASRFLVEIDRANRMKFEKLFSGLPIGMIGRVVKGTGLRIVDLNNRTWELSSSEIKRAWRGY
ncbi:MAG: phosphoribosylformylglycinamidine synthase subunit PurL [Crenarchaeota archaeon]|nr:phosphoribosylformylglycinamidine synthase subunit PurL [Thermoproteota archaeon]MDW8034616.1 phosphoribosylformylglycinamidine synthase subunit PurL [Nitrososphaerota archaeon]